MHENLNFSFCLSVRWTDVDPDSTLVWALVHVCNVWRMQQYVNNVFTRDAMFLA